MTFIARYKGVCAACDEEIEVGDRLRYNPDDEVVHDSCKEVPIAKREVCTECWLEKPCPCEDGL